MFLINNSTKNKSDGKQRRKCTNFYLSKNDEISTVSMILLQNQSLKQRAVILREYLINFRFNSTPRILFG